MYGFFGLEKLDLRRKVTFDHYCFVIQRVLVARRVTIIALKFWGFFQHGMWNVIMWSKELLNRTLENYKS